MTHSETHGRDPRKTQQALPLEVSHRERFALLMAAWERVEADPEIGGKASLSVRLIAWQLLGWIHDAAGYATGEDGLRRTRKALSLKYRCSLRTLDRVLSLLRASGLVEIRENATALGRAENSYRIDWSVVDRLRRLPPSPALARGTASPGEAPLANSGEGPRQQWRSVTPLILPDTSSPTPTIEAEEGEKDFDQEGPAPAGLTSLEDRERAHAAAILAVARAGIGTARNVVAEAQACGYSPERIVRLAELLALEQAKTPPTFASPMALAARLTQPVDLDDREGWVCGRLPEPQRPRPPREDPEIFRGKLWRHLADQDCFTRDEIEARVDAALRKKFPDLYPLPSEV